jgi:DNA-binding NtrC family response regulator
MTKKILIVEDEFIEANNLQMILERAGYDVCKIASSVNSALTVLNQENPDIVLIDIFLKGAKTGIDLAKILKERKKAFVYLSANSDSNILAMAKLTEPYGFLIKPFREKDVLIMIDIANFLHEQKQKLWLREQYQKDKEPLEPFHVDGIIGNSALLQDVLQYINLVAPTETSVLIFGESGTGKEKLVKTIHENSVRRSQPLIKVNCAALPASLIESELFGHERGAFTGAVERRIGKFEQANGGTVFLDEIGELPLEIQVKLLHVLQDREIERVGGTGPIKINVRFIAATNRNLEQEISEGRFRMDLYYRLNVFPIILPPLRNRKEDIPLLVEHFVRQMNIRNLNGEKSLSDHAMAGLINYDWPGNIRELENHIERSFLLSSGPIIDEVQLPNLLKNEVTKVVSKKQRVKTMAENETEYILEILEICNGKLSGPGGAAELLGIPYTTLTSKIKRLGIKTDHIYK